MKKVDYLVYMKQPLPGLRGYLMVCNKCQTGYIGKVFNLFILLIHILCINFTKLSIFVEWHTTFNNNNSVEDHKWIHILYCDKPQKCHK